MLRKDECHHIETKLMSLHAKRVLNSHGLFVANGVPLIGDSARFSLFEKMGELIPRLCDSDRDTFVSVHQVPCVGQIPMQSVEFFPRPADHERP